MTDVNRFYDGSLVLVKYEDNWHYVWFYDSNEQRIRWFCLEEYDDELHFDRFEDSYTQEINRIIDERDADYESSSIYEEWLPRPHNMSRRYIS